MAARKELGDWAEDAARKYLVDKGYRIEAVKWRGERFEIDLIASRDGLLIFVEVKASTRLSFGAPELRVNLAKQRRIAAAASQYLALSDTQPSECRFDVIGIVRCKDGQPRITHIESAFVIRED